MYVIAPENGVVAKMGTTRGLRQRLRQLQEQRRETLHTFFWAEFDTAVAFRVERAAHHACTFDVLSGKEWYLASPLELADIVVSSMVAVGIKPYAVAGDPWCVDAGMSEVAEMLAEPVHFIDRDGRLDREEWAPHRRSFSY